jgi:A/G-specific adenine glycosylase
MAVDQQIIAAKLLDWYDRHARSLPWRVPPNDDRGPDPYHVWLSEIMLQQTTVAAVGPYFARFLALWPTVDALAAADDADVMREWAGLGYYARARNLLAAARVVAANGGFPETEAGLRGLPGVGPYTAAAIAAIAFGEPAVVIDGNIERITSRLFALPDVLPAGRPRLAAALAPLVPPDRPGDFAQAMMDLGATICTPRKPLCSACPLAAACAAAIAGTPEAFPVKAPRRPRPLKHGTVWWIEHGGQVALVRRPAKGLLGGMLALPGTEWGTAQDHALPFPSDWRLLTEGVRHGFTHFELELKVASTALADRRQLPPGIDPVWTGRADVAAAGLPTLFARAAALALAHLPLLEGA